MLRLETPWGDDDDLPIDDPVPDEDDPGEDDDEDDEEPLRAKRKGPPREPFAGRTEARVYCSPITATVIVTVTSVCSTTSIGNSPTCLSGPCDMRTCERSTSWPCFSSASTMS